MKGDEFVETESISFSSSSVHPGTINILFLMLTSPCTCANAGIISLDFPISRIIKKRDNFLLFSLLKINNAHTKTA